MILPEQLRNKLYKIIFESETRAGKIFDIFLMGFILLSVLLVMLESVDRYMVAYGQTFYVLNIIITIVFGLEYLLRCLSVPKPIKYMTSFYGVIDLVAVLPFLLELLFPQMHFLSVIRILRLLRIFRIFKMVSFLEESNVMLLSLWESRRKIYIFLFFVLLLGNCYSYYSWIRRHFSCYTTWESICICHYDTWLCYHCRTNRNCYSKVYQCKSFRVGSYM